MRYTRVLVLVALMAAIGLGAMALARSSPSSHVSTPRQLHSAVQQMAEQFMLGARRAQAPSIIIPAPQIGGTTCYVATQCSIRPCVVPVASAVAALPTLPNAVTRCPLGDRVPNFRVTVAH